MAHEKLKKPFTWPWAVSHLVCTECNSIMEIDEETTDKLFSVMQKLNNEPEEIREKALKDHFFESNYCKKCGQKDTLVLEFKKIK